MNNHLVVLFRIVCLFEVAWKGLFAIFGGGILKSSLVSTGDKMLRKKVNSFIGR